MPMACHGHGHTRGHLESLAQTIRWRLKAATCMESKHKSPTCCTEPAPCPRPAPHCTAPPSAGTCRGQAAPLAICDGIANAQKKTICRAALSTVNNALA
jgi:hypothetical protein